MSITSRITGSIISSITSGVIPIEAGIPTPIIDLSSPANQAVTNSDIVFDEWTIDIMFDMIAAAPMSVMKLWDLDGDAADDVFLHFTSAGKLQFTLLSDGVSPAQTWIIDAGDYLRFSEENIVTISAKEGLVIIAINGIVVNTIDNWVMATGTPDGIGVGQNYSGTQPYSDTINRFRYWDKALTEGQIISLHRDYDYGITATYDASRLIHYSLGQSNSVGTKAFIPDDSIYQNLADISVISKSGSRVSPYVDPSCTTTGGGSVWSNFQQSGKFSAGGVTADVIAGETGRDVAVMHIDRGNTDLVSNSGNFRWLAWDTSTTGMTILRPPAYQAIIMEKIGKLWGQAYSRTWWQGENDAADAGISQVQYANALTDLLTVLDKYNPITTAIVKLGDTPSSGYTNWATIKAAQQDVIDAYGRAVGVDADNQPKVPDEIHYTSDGFYELGYDIAEAILNVTATPPVFDFELLDNFTGAKAAWSVARLLRSGYTGDAVRVRRSSDDAEQDIGFVTVPPYAVPRLDETALTTFVGAMPDALEDYDFSGDGSAWTLGSNTTLIDGEMVMTGESGLTVRQNVSEQAVQYDVTFTISEYTSGSVRVYAGGNQSAVYSAAGTYTITLVGGTANDIFALNPTGANMKISEFRAEVSAFYATDFSTDTGWTLGTGVTISGGAMNFATTGAVDSYEGSTAAPNQTVRVTFTISDYVAGDVQYLNFGQVTTGTARSANGTYVEEVTLGANGNQNHGFRTSNFIGKIDDFVIEQITADGLVTKLYNQAEDEITYTSDFSIDTDGWANDDVDATAGVTFAGESDCVQVVMTNGNQVHQFSRALAFITGLRYRVSFDYYVPSSNVELDSFIVTGSSDFSAEVATTDAWTSYSVEGTSSSTTIQIRFRSDAGTNNFIDADGDVMYIKNVQFTLLASSYGLAQSVTSRQPRIVNAGVVEKQNGQPCIYFDDSFMEASAFGAQSENTSFGVFKDDGGENQMWYSFAANGGSAALGLYYWGADASKHFGFNTWNVDSWGYNGAGTEVKAQNITTAHFLDGNPTSSGVELWVNGSSKSLSQVQGTSVSRNMDGGFRLGYGGVSGTTQDFSGNFQEIIIFDGDKTADREGIEGNINEFYGVY